VAFDVSNNSNGMAFVLATAAVWECIAFACSSPQTAELNIKKREESLMFWVHAGQGLSLATILIGAALQKKTRNAILLGGAFGMASSEFYYILAMRRGHERKDQEPTEDWDKREEGGVVYG
jgi:hypothetical protein